MVGKTQHLCFLFLLALHQSVLAVPSKDELEQGTNTVISRLAEAHNHLDEFFELFLQNGASLQFQGAPTPVDLPVAKTRMEKMFASEVQSMGWVKVFPVHFNLREARSIVEVVLYIKGKQGDCQATTRQFLELQFETTFQATETAKFPRLRGLRMLGDGQLEDYVAMAQCESPYPQDNSKGKALATQLVALRTIYVASGSKQHLSELLTMFSPKVVVLDAILNSRESGTAALTSVYDDLRSAMPSVALAPLDSPISTLGGTVVWKETLTGVSVGGCVVAITSVCKVEFKGGKAAYHECLFQDPENALEAALMCRDFILKDEL